MKFQSILARRVLAGLFTATLFASFSAPSAWAHIAPCPYCSLTVSQDTATQDNEVALKIGRKRIEYKCVFCALSEAQSDYQGDLSILAPSEKKGEPIMLMRQNGKWSSMTEGAAYVLNSPLQHKICSVQARAFGSQAAAQAYLDAHKDQLPSAKIVTLDELVKASGADAGNGQAPVAQGDHAGK